MTSASKLVDLEDRPAATHRRGEAAGDEPGPTRQPSIAAGGQVKPDTESATVAVRSQISRVQEPQQECRKAEVQATISPFSAVEMQISDSTDCQPTCLLVPASSAHTHATYSVGASLQQRLDAQVPELSRDSRRGSPCQRTAADLMELADVRFSAQEGSDGLQSTFSQTMEENFPGQQTLAEALGNANLSSQLSQGNSSREDNSNGPIPGMVSQPDWFSSMMKQAQDAGLWGGGSSEKRLQRAPSPPTGLPTLSETMLPRGASGFQDSCGGREDSSLALYESSMAALLPPRASEDEWQQQPPPPEGLGIISRQSLGDSRGMPRLAPVSLGMTHSGIQAAFAGRQNLPESGPFRPSTRRRLGGSAGETDGAMLHPMLHQSKLQLSLGLAADKPINLQAWGYGGNSSDGAGAETSLASGGTATAVCYATETQGEGSEVQVGKQQAVQGPSPPSSLPVSPSAATHVPFRLSPFSTGVSTSATHMQQEAAGEGEPRSRVRAETGPAGMSQEEAGSRAECLERYREKKRRRLFSKTIRYHKRKVNADKRPRVKGRFVKASDADSAVPAEEVHDPGTEMEHDLEDDLFGLGA